MKRYKVRLLPSAHNDLKIARAWYRQHDHNLPKRFTQQINLSIARIREAPFAYAVRYKEVHIANVSVFPYAVHFIVSEDTVIIIAVHHTAINSETWDSRL